MTDRFDVMVAGTGSMGAATTFSLAAAGVKVLTLEQSEHIPDEEGSHADKTGSTAKMLPNKQMMYRWGRGLMKTGKHLTPLPAKNDMISPACAEKGHHLLYPDA